MELAASLIYNICDPYMKVITVTNAFCRQLMKKPIYRKQLTLVNYYYLLLRLQTNKSLYYFVYTTTMTRL